jgi:hypothetical protein
LTELPERKMVISTGLGRAVSGETMQTAKSVLHIFGLVAVGFLAAGGFAHAQVTEADVGVNKTFTQTSGGVTSAGGFFGGRAFVTGAGDFTGGTLTYGGPGSPQTLSYVPGDVAWEYGEGNASFSDLQAAFPNGAYRFDLTGGTMGPTSVALNYDGDAYANTPELSAASFAALQGIGAGSSISLDFNAMDVSPNATPGANNIFFSIVDTATNMTVFDSGALATTVTNVTIPGGVFVAGQTYTFDLLFDDRIVGTDANGVPIVQFYDSHTGGSFSVAAAAAPEPSTWAMLFIGFAGLGALMTRRAAALKAAVG